MAARPGPGRGQPIGALLIVASIFGFAWAFHLVTVRPAPLQARAPHQMWSAFARAAVDVPQVDSVAAPLLEVAAGDDLPVARLADVTSSVRRTDASAVPAFATALDRPASASSDQATASRAMPEPAPEAAPLTAQAWAPATLPQSIAPSGAGASPGGPAHAVSRAFVRTGSAIGLAFKKTGAGVKTVFD